MPNMEDKLGYVPSGTRFVYSATWSNSTLGELASAGVITAQGVATQVQTEIQGGLTVEGSGGGSYFAFFSGGNNVSMNMLTTTDFGSQAEIQSVMDAYVQNALGNYGTLTSSSIDSFTLPAEKTTDTGAPGANTGWGLSDLAGNTVKSVTDALSPNLSTKLVGAGLVLVLVLVALFYFLPAQGARAVGTLKGGR